MGRLGPMLYGHTVSSSLYAAAFLLVWYQDILGADYLETTREHPTGELEALGGLPRQVYTAGIHVFAWGAEW